jgi:hypothetical protein
MPDRTRRVAAMNHKKNLRTLFQTYLKNCGDTLDQKKLFFFYLLNWVPEPAAPKVFQEQGLTYTGDEKRLLYQTYWALGSDKRTEHLEERKLNEKFTHLLAEVLERKDEFKDAAKLNALIDEFLAEIVKAEEDYRVMFKVRNMKAKVKETQFWDCVVASYDREQLIAWGFDPEESSPVSVEDFEGRTVIVVSEKGTNSTEVVKRARVKATRRLRVLQNYLKEEFIHDEQLVFGLSKEYAVKKEGASRLGWGLDNKNSPIAYDYPEALVERVGEANKDFERIKRFPTNIQEIIERALHWIGLAISEIDPDLKVAFLSTALETLLTTKDDGHKGERIAYRGYLLGQEVGSDDYHMPQKVLTVYVKRSTVVHGSGIGLASRKDYWLMLDFAQATLKNFIQYVGEHNLTKPTAIFKKLLQSDKVNPLLVWLDEAFDDEESRDIAAALRKDLPKIESVS